MQTFSYTCFVMSVNKYGENDNDYTGTREFMTNRVFVFHAHFHEYLVTADARYLCGS